ncbi:NUDIX domain-containing protein [Bacillus sp. Marseille-Q3570]|uniref:NUDIX hydrolase n=1 Tax=Bacillus sp. Marseille-Q3570 TaxID=2963522 RepID=UPI0021B70DBB|nr:NUDIX domain-containing protein [Bacillus sp. Marseille-Q3570]
MRNRSGIILIQSNHIALIKRMKKSQTYYVIPGGGIEDVETPEEAARREAKEELGVNVMLKGLLHTENWNGMQYYFLAEIIDGKFGNGSGAEMNGKNEAEGKYIPMWVNVTELTELPLRPKSIIDKILSLPERKLCKGQALAQDES